MAINNIEIEVKIKVNKDDFQRLKNNIDKVSEKKKKEKHIDTYYYPLKKKGYFDTEIYPYKWIRIREFSEKSILTFKHHFPEGKKKHNYCNEYETVINNKESMDVILKELGLVQTIKVIKERETFIFKNIEISFDIVDKLGYFVEFEALDNIENKTKDTLNDFIKSLNITYEIVEFGYPLLIKKC